MMNQPEQGAVKVRDRRVLVAVLLVLMMTLVTACSGRAVSGATASPPKKRVIGVSLPEVDNPFYAAMKNWLEKEGPAAGLEMRILIANRDSAKQVADLQTFMNDKVDALVLSAVDGNAVMPVINSAKAARVPIVTLARPLPAADGVLAHIGSDDVALGRIIGQYLEQKLGTKGGNLVLLRGPATASYANNMEKGLLEVLKKSSQINVIATVASPDTQAEGQKQMARLLEEHPQIDAVYCVNDVVALGALEALKAAGRTNVVVTGANGNQAAIDSIKAGGLAFTLAKEPGKQSVLAIRALVDHFDGLTVRKTQFTLGTGVTKENVDKADIRYAK